MSITSISSYSEEEVTSLVRCSRSDCRPGRCIFCLLYKSKRVIHELKEFDSGSSFDSSGSHCFWLNDERADDSHSDQEEELSNLGVLLMDG